MPNLTHRLLLIDAAQWIFYFVRRVGIFIDVLVRDQCDHHARCYECVDRLFDDVIFPIAQETSDLLLVLCH